MQAVQSIEREKRMDGGKRKRRRTIPILLPQSRKGRSVSGRNCSLRSGLLALALLPVFDTTSPGKGGGWNRAGARHGSFTPPRFSRSCVQAVSYTHLDVYKRQTPDNGRYAPP